MSLEKILSISGKPGLYKMTKQTRSGFLAASLIDQKKISVSARHNVSLLTEIAIYTLTQEVPLREVFQKIAAKEDSKQTISHKVSKIELEEFFFGIVPDYDEQRVYPSDIKKVVQWYNLLIKNGFKDFSEPDQEKDKQEPQAPPSDKKQNPSSTKKTVSKQVQKPPAKATKKVVTQHKKTTTAKKK